MISVMKTFPDCYYLIPRLPSLIPLYFPRLRHRQADAKAHRSPKLPPPSLLVIDGISEPLVLSLTPCFISCPGAPPNTIRLFSSAAQRRHHLRPKHSDARNYSSRSSLLPQDATDLLDPAIKFAAPCCTASATSSPPLTTGTTLSSSFSAEAHRRRPNPNPSGKPPLPFFHSHLIWIAQLRLEVHNRIGTSQ
jgi:hypothetical protein